MLVGLELGGVARALMGCCLRVMHKPLWDRVGWLDATRLIASICSLIGMGPIVFPTREQNFGDDSLGSST